jgi:hypothetical protein
MEYLESTAVGGRRSSAVAHRLVAETGRTFASHHLQLPAGCYTADDHDDHFHAFDYAFESVDNSTE